VQLLLPPLLGSVTEDVGTVDLIAVDETCAVTVLVWDLTVVNPSSLTGVKVVGQAVVVEGWAVVVVGQEVVVVGVVVVGQGVVVAGSMCKSCPAAMVPTAASTAKAKKRAMIGLRLLQRVRQSNVRVSCSPHSHGTKS
jgi:hypothetical protein